MKEIQYPCRNIVRFVFIKKLERKGDPDGKYVRLYIVQEPKAYGKLSQGASRRDTAGTDGIESKAGKNSLPCTDFLLTPYNQLDIIQ